MPEDACTKYLPKAQMVKKEILVDETTGGRYTRTEVGYYQIPDLATLFHAPDFRPPDHWSEFQKSDSQWDRVFLDRMGDEYSIQRANPDIGLQLVDPWTQIMHMGKSYCRKQLEGKVDMCGVITWAWFTTIEPCWLIMNRRNAIWLRSEEELGLQHG